MKLLVSDYDGTLKSDLKNLSININAIKKFMNNNKFMISTGRGYESIKKEIDKYKIPYDYLTCNDGSVIFNNNNELLFSNTVDAFDAFEIVEFIKNINYISSFETYNQYKKSKDLNNLIEIFCKFYNKSDIQILKKYLKEKYQNIDIHTWGKSAFIKNEFSKSDGIKKLLEITNIPAEDVITVGDNKNDLEMLKDYNGYKVLYSYPCLYFKGIKTTREVHTLIKKINK